MKKLLYIALVLATAVGFTSCDKDDNSSLSDDIVESYTGTLTVTNMSDGSDYTKSDVTFDFNDMTQTLTMWGVGFSEAMPVSVDIVIAYVPLVSSGVYSSDSITATLQDGSPAPDFISDLTDVLITETSSALTVIFNVDVTLYGATTTYGFIYEGTEAE